jgi:hypothetical protein
MVVNSYFLSHGLEYYWCDTHPGHEVTLRLMGGLWYQLHPMYTVFSVQKQWQFKFPENLS